MLFETSASGVTFELWAHHVNSTAMLRRLVVTSALPRAGSRISRMMGIDVTSWARFLADDFERKEVKGTHMNRTDAH